MKLSIIIPVYNVEPFISRCLDSCYNQNLPEDDYEIICVDDGSTDGSMAIVEKYACLHKNLVILHQANAGQSIARNQGLQIAQSDYIWFVDSDDWIQPNVLPYLLEHVYRDHLDTLCFTFQYAYEDGRFSDGGFSMPSLNKAINGREFISNYSMPAGPWSAIHRRAFLKEKNLRFIEGIKREDEDYTIRAYCSAEKISYINIVAYNYFQRAGSTMKSPKSAKTADDLLVVADSLFDYAQSIKGVHKQAYLSILNHVSFAFSQSLAYCDIGKSNLEKYKAKPYYPLNINPFLSKKNKWKYRLINYSIEFYLKLYQLK